MVMAFPKTLSCHLVTGLNLILVVPEVGSEVLQLCHFCLYYFME
jgi:hypothetical protein